MKKRAVLLLLLLPALSFAGETDFKEGIVSFRAEKYIEAIESLKASHENLPLIGDYALLFMARAYLKNGDVEKSNEALGKLLGQYPETPLRKTVRAMLIKNTADTDKALTLLGHYLRDYPEDDEMLYMQAQLLKPSSPEEAMSVLKGLYIKAGPFSQKAGEELKPSELPLSDLIKRASNLIKAVRYKEAEAVIRDVLTCINDETLKKDALDTLALSLFRQKRYKEAGDVYVKVPDIYNAANSFLRAGDYVAFNGALDKLVSASDARAGRLLIIRAVKDRREGKVHDALRVLSEVKAKYPADAEEALWHIGWTYYLQGDYTKALDIFTGLYDKHRTTGYLYWKARATEKTGGPAVQIYSELRDKNDFYGALTALRNGWQTAGNKVSAGKQGQKSMLSFQRPDILIEAGLKEDAIAELAYISRGITSAEDLTVVAHRFNELGEYRRAISLVMNLPETKRPHDILYPGAYWQEITEASARNNLDPFLVLSIIREESRFDPGAYSIAGAIGLMQVMPETAERLAGKLKIRVNDTGHIYDTGLNIRLGSYHLACLIKEFGSPGPAIAAYNAGEQKVRAWLNNGKYTGIDEFIEDIPYVETRQYLMRTITTYLQYRQEHPPSALFNLAEPL